MASTRSTCSATLAPATMLDAAIAPALIIGLRGRWVTGCRLISLKRSPEGSTSILASTWAVPLSTSAMPYVNAFEIDWMQNGRSVSPTSYA